MAKRRKRKKSMVAVIRSRLGDLEFVSFARASRPIGWCIIIVASVLAWIIGVPHLRAAVAAQTATGDVTIEFVGLPAWVRGDLLAMLDLTARDRLSGDALAREDLVSVRSALLATGWFDAIQQVQRTGLGTITITGTFVQPAAVIRDEDGDHLIDPTGKLLPRTFPPDGAKAQIVIEGVQLERPPTPGQTWAGADVTAALRVLRLVRTRPWRNQVAAIDVGRFVTEETLLIVTDRGSRLVWGSAPGAERPLEVPAVRKLARLDTAYEELGHIDAGYRGILDLTNPRGVIGK